MPADADILCEYYITSNLKPSSSSSLSTNHSTSINKNKLFNNTKKANNSSGSSDSNIKSVLLESIDFFKYDKNPMDYLKTKYQLLNTSSSSANTSSIINSAQNIKLLNGTSNNNGITRQPAQQNNSQATASSPSAQGCLPNKTNSTLDLSWNKIKKTGLGLLNLGNNCYLNATLQCLAYTPPLSQWLIAKTHSVTCKFKAVKGFCSLCEVEKIIHDIFNGCNGCAKPNSLCFNIRSTFVF